MTPKTKYYETLANTMIKNFEKRRMEAYYYPCLLYTSPSPRDA